MCKRKKSSLAFLKPPVLFFWNLFYVAGYLNATWHSSINGGSILSFLQLLSIFIRACCKLKGEHRPNSFYFLWNVYLRTPKRTLFEKHFQVFAVMNGKFLKSMHSYTAVRKFNFRRCSKLLVSMNFIKCAQISKKFSNEKRPPQLLSISDWKLVVVDGGNL